MGAGARKGEEAGATWAGVSQGPEMEKCLFQKVSVATWPGYPAHQPGSEVWSLSLSREGFPGAPVGAGALDLLPSSCWRPCGDSRN